MFVPAVFTILSVFVNVCSNITKIWGFSLFCVGFVGLWGFFLRQLFLCLTHFLDFSVSIVLHA